MANMAKTRSLFNKKELKSFEKVLDRRRVGGLSEAQLKKKISLARKAMVKYRDLARKQRQSIKKIQGQGMGSQKTEAKQQIFIEIQESLKDRLDKLSAKAKKTKKASVRGKSRPNESIPLSFEGVEETASAKLASRQQRRQAVSLNATAKVNELHWSKTPIKRIIGHESSRTRRHQGARDRD